MLNTTQQVGTPMPPEAIREPDQDTEHDTLREAIEAGADPVEVRRALLVYGTGGQAARVLRH